MRLLKPALRSVATRRSRCPVVQLAADLPQPQAHHIRWLHRLTAAGFVFFLLKGMLWMAIGIWVLHK